VQLERIDSQIMKNVQSGKPIAELRSITCHMRSHSAYMSPGKGERVPP